MDIYMSKMLTLWLVTSFGLTATLFRLVEGQTVGGNSEGMPCYFPYQYEGVMYTTCIDINHERAWCSTTEDYDNDRRWGECLAADLDSLPSFDESTPENVSVYEGETARLMCTVNNLQNKKVGWQMKGKRYPLTASTFSFLSNGRFVVEHEYDSQWNLLIHRANMSDSGIYQCRVTTQTMLLVREVHLTVKDLPPTVPPEVSLGNREIIYVTKGAELKLQCNSTGRYYEPPSQGRLVVPPEVEWFKGDGNKIDSHSLNRIVINNQVDGALRMSTLIIEKADMKDAGVYICRNTEEVHAEVTVRVLNVDRDNNKRDTVSDPPNTLGQLGDASSSTAPVLSALVLILSFLSYNMT